MHRPRLRPLATLLPPLLLVSACVAPERAPPPPAPAAASVAVPAPPPRTTDWRDIPLTPGDWRYAATPDGSAALFGIVGAVPDFVVRCDRATRAVSLARTGIGPGGGTGETMALTTSAGDRALAAVSVAGPPPALAATLPARDGFLDRMAFSRGRFIVAVTGTTRLAIPSWPEFARVIEDCRG